MYIAVDFDGTIVDHRFPEIGAPVPGAFAYLKKFKNAGATLILWTMRSDGQEHGDVLSSALEFCSENGVEFDFANEHPQHWTTSPKVYAHVYIDDAAFGCPLVDNPEPDGRPFVDWAEVGPQILESLRQESGI